VRAVLTGVMLASLLMAAALPSAFGAHGVLFAISYVVLQVGRNAAAASLLGRDQPLRDVFERLVGWSAASGVLWLAGAALPGDRRLLLWIPAVVLDLCAPVAGYWLPRRGRAVTTDYDKVVGGGGRRGPAVVARITPTPTVCATVSRAARGRLAG
jgi:low temperature requirement protein LtrA